MTRGSQRYDSLEDAHLGKTEMQIPVSQAFLQSKKEGIALVSREVSVVGSSTDGRIDKVVVEPDRLIIIDDKPGKVAYFTSQLQV
jgi:hypothetical protein